MKLFPTWKLNQSWNKPDFMKVVWDANFESILKTKFTLKEVLMKNFPISEISKYIISILVWKKSYVLKKYLICGNHARVVLLYHIRLYIVEIINPWNHRADILGQAYLKPSKKGKNVTELFFQNTL